MQLLILDDWGLGLLDAAARHDLLEILEERYGRRSTIITSQLPVDKWHDVIGDPTYADAILDRLVHNAHRIDLIGDMPARLRAWATSRRNHGRHQIGTPGQFQRNPHAKVMQWLFFEQYYVEPAIGSLRFWTMTGRLELNAGRMVESRRETGARASPPWSAA